MCRYLGLGPALLGSALLAACTDNVPDPDGAPPEPPTLQGLTAGIVVPGSTLSFVGSGFLTPPAGETSVRLLGTLDDDPVTLTFPIAELTGTALRLTVTQAALEAAGHGEGGVFAGDVEVVVRPADREVTLQTFAPLSFEHRPSLSPQLSELGPARVAPGAVLIAQGEGFISEGEGQSYLSLSGRFDDAYGGGWDLTEAILPLTSRVGRREGVFYLKPSMLSLAPGRFFGQATLRTTDLEGVERESEPVVVELVQEAPQVEAIDPAVVARGQTITLTGNGFLPNDPRARTATLITATGTFQSDLGGPPQVLEGPTAFRLMPQVWLDNGEIRATLQTQQHPETGELVGLGANAGTFTGTFVVSLFSGLDRVDTDPVPATLHVAPMTQKVWLNYRPGFSEGLALFGLQWAEPEIRARVLEVCRRDFDGFRVDFSETRPAGWAEYVTVDIGGRDPNNLGLFGLDNTLEKDDGNISLSERIGGLNAESAAAGILAYGGVFVESFLTLSPDHPTPAIIASPAFDKIFSPFSPALSAEAQSMSRADLAPGAPREIIAREAIRVLGNLVGTTISHEVGHTLGLASVDGDVHNPVDTDGGLMDRGEFRSFEERAELAGEGPSRFLGANRAYLTRLLGEAP